MITPRILSVQSLLRAAVALGFLISLLPPAAPTLADGGISLIRDAEIESTVHDYVEPIFTAAGLDAAAVKVHIINDNRINSFVAGGLNVFINTGLLRQSQSPNEVIGVLAHETGHLAGGHLARREAATENATTEAIIAMVLGAAVAVATGKGEAAGAIMGGGTSVAQQGLASFSQGQEKAADQAAMSFLEATGQSAEGLLHLFQKLEGQELLVSERQSPYLRTHPLTHERLLFVEDHVAHSRFTGVTDPPKRMAKHRRMVAKLTAFLEYPANALKAYPESDTSLEGHYARAVIYHRLADVPRALKEIDTLLAAHPDDPYFQELKGQILFENGRLDEALGPYQRASDLLPNVALIRFELARLQIETGKPELIQAATDHLRVITETEPLDINYWHFYGIALGQGEQIAQSALAFAEENLLRGDYPAAHFHAKKASEGLKSGSPEWLRAQDILNEAENRREAKH
jgi:predicted Zn-dependent protease